VLAGTLAGCNEGTPSIEPSTGPPLHVISTYPEDGAGFECAIEDVECGVPIDATFELRFDRYLLPSTAVRQSFFVYSGDPSNMVPDDSELPVLFPNYDVIERVVTYALPPGAFLEPNTHYTAELVLPIQRDDPGFRAFDSEPLHPRTTRRLSFLTSNQRKAPVSEPVGTCSDVLRTFTNRCDSAGCHNTTDREMDLDLSNASGLSLTAIGRVAHQAETGTKTGVPLQNPARFGVGMPRIDRGRPDNSYLMYKLVTARENYRRTPEAPDLCATRHLAAVDPETCVPATEDENERLRAWFLRGVGMPRAVGDAEPSFLVRRELLGVESWIRSGAPCP
jgi:hypothetical protein